MKILECMKCNKTQSGGSFCLDCGSKLKEKVTSTVNFKPIKTSRTAKQLERDIRNWLNRVGVHNQDITINSSDGARVEYVLNGMQYSFMSHLQNTVTKNLAAVEQFLHSRVLGIERGIEDVEKAFKGYEALPDFSKGVVKDCYEALGFDRKVDLETAKKKFKELAKMCHPDVNNSPMAAEQFKSISEAIREIEDRQ